jgi:hypothetical protein
MGAYCGYHINLQWRTSAAQRDLCQKHAYRISTANAELANFVTKLRQV